MSKHIDQIYVQSDDLATIGAALTEYCRQYEFSFAEHPRANLDGIRQTLEFLKNHRRNRCFWLLPPVRGWVCMWEVVDNTQFADHEVARFLSEVLGCTAYWIILDEDYNIWAFQRFEKGNREDELFRPEEYFSSASKEGDFDSYGLCFGLAEAFNRDLDLPHFLLSMPDLMRQKNLKSSITRLMWRP
jgi:hypothetical protein